jgi:hypothetical protein
MIRIGRIALVPIALVVVPSIVPAQGDGYENVLIKVQVTRDDRDGGETRKAYELLTRNGRPAELLAGNRVPFAASATVPGKEGETGTIPVAAYTYQNLGITIQAEPKILDDSRMNVSGQIEITDAEPGAAGSIGPQPIVTTFRQQFAATLTAGKPTTVARFSRHDGGTMDIVLEGRIVD